MPSRSRERQLAKHYERRQAERQSAARRKRVIATVVGSLVGLAAIAIAIAIVNGDPTEPGGSGAPTLAPSVQPSATQGPSASGAPGMPLRTGEVTPQVVPPATVACAGSVPGSADEPKGQYDAPPKAAKMLRDGFDYTATIATSCGSVQIELFVDQAPQTVASFVFLAREGYFDGLTFHRIIPGFVIQGGDPLGTGGGGPGYAFADETSPKLVFDRAGLLAMANSGPGTNGSQFFITLGGAEAAGHLNGLHTIFGEVTSGTEAIDAIAAVGDEASGAPSEAVFIESVTIDEERAPEASPSE